MFDLIDSLIATITVVLLLSLIVQSIQQIAKQVFHMKSKLMERELMALLTNTPYKWTWKPQAMQFTEAAEQHPEPGLQRHLGEGLYEVVDSLHRRFGAVED